MSRPRGESHVDDGKRRRRSSVAVAQAITAPTPPGSGIAIGAAMAYAAGRSMQTVLFGVDPADPTVFGAAIALAVVMTVAGSLLPTWRAVRIDPIAATRVD
jgi:hypothetical protein